MINVLLKEWRENVSKERREEGLKDE